MDKPICICDLPANERLPGFCPVHRDRDREAAERAFEQYPWPPDSGMWSKATADVVIDLIATAIAAARAKAEHEAARLRELCAWAAEFIEEPAWFPNEGDRQWWRERRAELAPPKRKESCDV